MSADPAGRPFRAAQRASPSSSVLDAAAVELLRVVAANEAGIPAAHAFAITAMRWRARPEAVTPAPLARAACRLDRLGLIVHLLDQRNRIHLSATPAGRSRLAAHDRRQMRNRTIARTSVAAGIVTPLLASCMAVVQRPTDVPAAAGEPKAAVRIAQAEVGGRLKWVVCHTPQACPEPTPKTRRTVAVAPQPPPAAAVQAPAPPPLPPPAPRFDAVSVFYATERAQLAATEQRHFQAARERIRRLAANEDARVFVVGMTDLTGPAAFNADLAERRADGVRDQLVATGIDRAKISLQIDTSASRGVPPQAVQRPVPKGRFAPFRRVDVVIMQRGPWRDEDLGVLLWPTGAAGPTKATPSPSGN